MSKFKFNDGGREAAGYKGFTGDCVVRAVSIAAGLDYATVYKTFAKHMRREALVRGTKTYTSPRQGVPVKAKWFRDYMASLGFKWTPTMKIGSGCKVHLDEHELPTGALVVAVSRHYTAVIDGVINDTYDPSRRGNRCVYGYWSRDSAASNVAEAG